MKAKFIVWAKVTENFEILLIYLSTLDTTTYTWWKISLRKENVNEI